MHRRRCRDCDARIRWARTPKGHWMALNDEPDAAGTVRVVGLDDLDELTGALSLPAHMTTLDGMPLGVAVTLNADEVAAARSLAWELFTPHRATCPRRRDR